MKKIIIVISLLALAGCGVGEVTAADDSLTASNGEGLSSSLTIGTTLVTTDYLNLRTGPGTGYSIQTVIPPGTPVSVVYHSSPTNGFYNILDGQRVGWSSGLYLQVGSPPPAKTLDTSVVAKIIEPPGAGYDDKGTSFTDKNYWEFCTPGAAAALLSYFNSNTTSWPAGYFKEPYGPHVSTTFWASSDSVSGYATVGRAYLMHLAMQVKPPTFSSAGLASFGSYPSTGSKLTDARDVLNWEASGHNSAWQSFFYQRVGTSGLTASTLHSDVRRDIYGGHAVLADVDTAYLPNWSRSVGHSIAIVGYDDNAGTYAYVDTCGRRCNGASQSTNGGVWHVSQGKMLQGLISLGVGYAR